VLLQLHQQHLDPLRSWHELHSAAPQASTAGQSSKAMHILFCKRLVVSHLSLSESTLLMRGLNQYGINLGCNNIRRWEQLWKAATSQQVLLAPQGFSHQPEWCRWP
jgi:hypothetical protein